MADVVDDVHFYATMMNVLSLSLCTSAGGPPGTSSDEEVMIFLWFHMMTPNKHKETPKKTQKQKDTTCTSPGGF